VVRRRALVISAIAVALAGAGAWNVFERPEPAKAARAIQRGPGGIFTWVVGEGDVVQERPITAGPTTGDVTIIMTALSEGERVVVNGQYKLRQKSKLTFTAPPVPVVAKQAQAS
jgi:hypothetical protein